MTLVGISQRFVTRLARKTNAYIARMLTQAMYN